MSNKPKIKICCISSLKEAKLAIKYGASAIGLVSEMPSGPGVISEELISEIALQIPSNIDSFLLTSKLTAEEIIEQHRKCKTTTLQIVDSVEHDVYKKLRSILLGIKIVQVIHVQDENSVDEALKVEKYVDAILLDSGNQKLKVKELGGTGRRHDWKISRKIREGIKIPMFLAGGINPENVVKAMEEVQPYGLDICSGVRINGKLNEELLKKLFSQINNYFT
jgi:phosphoribosylanthranilate isomerase